MTSEQHIELWHEHKDKALKALEAYRCDIHDFTLWEEYKAESKIANKHYGIARAMWTKRNNKFREQYGF